MIEKVTWKLGGHPTKESTSETFYLSERGTNVYYNNPLEIKDYIGLIYPSDYGYSALDESCSRNISLSDYVTENCSGSSWLYGKGSLWTINHNTNNASRVMRIESAGFLADELNANNGYIILPALYLKSGVKKISGDGSLENPYIIMY